MNWVIDQSEKMPYHTDLRVVTAPFQGVIDSFKWLLTNVEFTSLVTTNLPINPSTEYVILEPEEFRKLASLPVKIIWAVISAYPKELEIKIDRQNLPWADGNPDVWQPNHFELEEAEIEIVCFDSSQTIVKFRSAELSSWFEKAFPEASRLEDFPG